jgi:hypothetical protein
LTRVLFHLLFDYLIYWSIDRSIDWLIFRQDGAIPRTAVRCCHVEHWACRSRGRNKSHRHHKSYEVGCLPWYDFSLCVLRVEVVLFLIRFE